MKFLSWILISIMFLGSLFPKSGMYEITKISKLVLHYEDHELNHPVDHQEKNYFHDFLDFIQDHYSSDSNSEKNPDLPLYDLDFHGFTMINSIAKIPFLLIKPLFKSQWIIFPTTDYSFLNSHSSWQPPKM